MDADRRKLAEHLARGLSHDGTAEPQRGLFFRRQSGRAERVHSVAEPSFCVIAQGSKNILLGNEAFQKQLRLLESRRLMLAENLDAAQPGYRVGYDDASHFNKEYKRHFGRPPIRDVEHLRGAAPRASSRPAAATA